MQRHYLGVSLLNDILDLLESRLPQLDADDPVACDLRPIVPHLRADLGRAPSRDRQRLIVLEGGR